MSASFLLYCDKILEQLIVLFMYENTDLHMHNLEIYQVNRNSVHSTAKRK